MSRGRCQQDRWRSDVSRLRGQPPAVSRLCRGGVARPRRRRRRAPFGVAGCHRLLVGQGLLCGHRCLVGASHPPTKIPDLGVAGVLGWWDGRDQWGGVPGWWDGRDRWGGWARWMGVVGCGCRLVWNRRHVREGSHDWRGRCVPGCGGCVGCPRYCSWLLGLIDLSGGDVRGSSCW